MPRFVLNTNDGEAQSDMEGMDFETVDDARAWADSKLFALAMEVVARGDDPTLVLLMRDENDRPIYQASLAMQRTWLAKHDG